MIPNANIGALMRYNALRGSLDGLSDELRALAQADRKAYARRYTASDKRVYARAALAVRFLHEVCGLSLTQARESMVGVMREGRAFRFDCIPDVDALASKLYEDNGNVFVAEAAASLYRAAAEGTPWAKLWDNVLNVLRTGYLVEPGDTVH